MAVTFRAVGARPHQRVETCVWGSREPEVSERGGTGDPGSAGLPAGRQVLLNEQRREGQSQGESGGGWGGARPDRAPRLTAVGHVSARRGSCRDGEAGGRRFVAWKEPTSETVESWKGNGRGKKGKTLGDTACEGSAEKEVPPK